MQNFIKHILNLVQFKLLKIELIVYTLYKKNFVLYYLVKNYCTIES